MPNISYTIHITFRNINLRDTKQSLCLAVNFKTKGKVNLIPDVYVNTSVAAIWNALTSNINISVIRNGLVEVSQTDRKFTSVVFDHDLSKKSIPVEYFKADMGIPNGTYISHPKETPILDGGAN